MSKFKDFAKGFDIRSNAVWDFIKWAFGGGTLLTAVYTAVISFISSIPLNWAIVFGLFVSSFVIISIIHLLQKRLNVKEISQNQTKTEASPQTRKPIYAMFGIAAVFLIAGFFIGKSANNKVPTDEFWSDKSFIQIKNRTFNNEKILLDGHEYIGCTFNNVTFEYNGTAAFNFTNNTIAGSYRFSSDSNIVNMTMILVNGLTQSSIRVVDSDGKPLEYIKPIEIINSSQKQ